MPTAPSTIAPPPRPQPPVPRLRERELPRLFERATLSILALATLLLAWSWSRVEGYQIADSVEYLERAHNIVLGVPMIDSQAIRSFGFSGLFIPLFGVARIFERYGPVPQAANVLQIALVLALLVVTMRLAARLAGRRAGYAAGLMLLASPAILRWGVTPISGIAAALFVALALSELIDEERNRRPALRGLVAGLWLGAALLMAYQTVMVIAPILAVVLLRREPRGFRPALICGVLACVLLQCFLDLAYYGRFGASLGYYVLENFGSNFAKLVYHTGDKLHLRKLMDASQWLYNEIGRAGEIDFAVQEAAKASSKAIQQRQPPTWYLENLAQGLPWAAAVLVVLGVARSFVRRNWKAMLLVLVVALNVGVMSLKGSKEFRLWLPFLPLVAVIGALGWQWLAGEAPIRRSPRALLACALVAAALVLGVSAHAETNVRRHGGFWRAMEYVNRIAKDRDRALRTASHDGRDPPRLRVASSYHWAVFLRESPRVELLKLPRHLDTWAHMEEWERTADLTAIASLDYFLVHLPTLTERALLMEAVNRDFAVRAVFFERAAYAGLGPVYVLGRRTGARGEPALYDVDVPIPGSEAGLSGREVRFEGGDGDPPGWLHFLGFEFQPIDGDGHGWITYTWRGGGFADRDYTLVDRLTCARHRFAWQNNHEPAYGMLPTSEWGEERTLREGYLLVAEDEPFRAEGPDQPLGGAYLRGDKLPTDLWFAVIDYGAGGPRYPKLTARRASDGTPISDLAPPGHGPSAEGWRTSADGLTWVGSCLIPVHPSARAEDPGPQAALRE
jgi:hypothetical protein